MFFKNRIKELNNEIKILKDKAYSQEKNIAHLEDQNEELKRIIKNYVPGEIHSVTEVKFAYNNTIYGTYGCTNYDTFIYINGEEYVFAGLRLYHPIFTQGTQNNVIYVNDTDDKDNCNSYVLDINACTYIQTNKTNQ